MEFPTLKDHNKKIENDVKSGRASGIRKMVGVICSVCYERDETETQLEAPDQDVVRNSKGFRQHQVFCATCKKSYWMFQ